MLGDGARWGCVLVCCAMAAPAATFEELAARADTARYANRVTEAVTLYRQALQLNPRWPLGWWYLGTLYYDSDQYKDGQQAFARLVQLEDKPAVWAFLGLCEFENGAYAQAQAHFEKALHGDLPPDLSQVVGFHDALLLTRAGLFDQAWQMYRPLVERGIDDPTLIAALGLNALGQAMLPRVIPRGQRDFVMAVGTATRISMSGDNDKAEAAFRSLLENYPNLSDAHKCYGAYLMNTQPDKAMQEFRRALELSPKAADTRAMLAILLFQSGRKDGAAEEARKAVADRPNSALAQYADGLTLKDPHQAVEHLKIAERLGPHNLECHIALAHVYAETGRHADERREREISLKLAKETSPGAAN